MSKFEKFLQILKASQSTIDIFSDAGVDVDKLVHIKHQQGYDGQIISGVLQQVSMLLDGMDPLPSVPNKTGKPIKKVSPIKKKTS